MVKKLPKDANTYDGRILKPNLFFPSIDKSSDFNQDLERCSRKYAEQFWGKKIATFFWLEFSRSKNIEYLKKYLKKDSHLTVYTGKEIKTVKEKLKSINNNNIELYSVQDKLEIHDRYAILDSELFHFGSTVGGFEKHFTAYSRGWEVRKIQGLLDYLNHRDCRYMQYIKKEEL